MQPEGTTTGGEVQGPEMFEIRQERSGGSLSFQSGSSVRS